jgi:phage shock protein PspC (stress-responsive transcriptional regulator)
MNTLKSQINRASGLLEMQLFGICTHIAEKMGVRTRQVRLSFIYLSFLTVGSPVAIYLIMWFWRQNKKIWQPWSWGSKTLDL